MGLNACGRRLTWKLELATLEGYLVGNAMQAHLYIYLFRIYLHSNRTRIRRFRILCTLSIVLRVHLPIYVISYHSYQSLLMVTQYPGA